MLLTTPKTWLHWERRKNLKIQHLKLKQKAKLGYFVTKKFFLFAYTGVSLNFFRFLIQTNFKQFSNYMFMFEETIITEEKRS